MSDDSGPAVAVEKVAPPPVATGRSCSTSMIVPAPDLDDILARYRDRLDRTVARQSLYAAAGYDDRGWLIR
ncbi:hypothetical protein [Altererythrobacter sp. BO-6]|uniref:hypothetical protein n=1 Tax=Altererythrobacter sp. BO-6 TaxID=2604537 RepID=UPI001F499C9A|nr:hypothetical protein [Altererythrobacter sp. BO-6]